MRIGLMMGESGFSHLCTLMKTPVFAGKKIRYGVALRGPSSQAVIESCYTHRGQRFGCRLYGHCPTLALVG